MKFLEFSETRDFPYYKHNPRLSKTAWIVLLVLIPISLLTYSLIGIFSEFIGSIVFCALLLIPLLYFSNWDVSLIFHKPSRDEIILAVLMFIGYIVYAIVVGSVLDSFALSGVSDTAYEVVDIESIVSLVYSMMGEELIKFIPLMFFLRVFFKYTNNRTLSITLSSIIIMIAFGLLHYYPPYMTLISVLVLQGAGSIFEIYAYVKTKNLLISYLSHLLTDMIIFCLLFLGV